MNQTVAYWIVAVENETGVFRNAMMTSNHTDKQDVIKDFEIIHSGYKVLDIGNGERPKAVQGLPYIA